MTDLSKSASPSPAIESLEIAARKVTDAADGTGFASVQYKISDAIKDLRALLERLPAKSAAKTAAKTAELVREESVWCSECQEIRPVTYEHMKAAKGYADHPATDILCDRFHIVATLHHPHLLASYLAQGAAESAPLSAEPRRDEREQFEAWACKTFDLDTKSDIFLKNEYGKKELGHYLNAPMQNMWLAWQAARASAVPLKQTADFTEAIHIAKSNFLTRSDVGKQYVTGYTDCRNEIVKRLESVSQPQTLQTPQECNCCTCGHPRGGHDYGLHTPCFSYGCDCKKYAASLPQPSALECPKCGQPVKINPAPQPSAGQMEELLVEISLIANSGSVDDFTVEGIRARLRDALYQYSAASEGGSNEKA